MNRATVGDYMTVDVARLRPDDGFKEIVWALAERGVSGAPVVDETGGVVGIVSEADILHKEEFKTAAEEPRRSSPRSRKTRTHRPDTTSAPDSSLWPPGSGRHAGPGGRRC